MIVHLSEESSAFVQAQLATGGYDSATEIVHHALHLWQVYQRDIAEIQKDVAEGITDIKAGRYSRISSAADAEELKQSIISQARTLSEQRTKVT